MLVPARGSGPLTGIAMTNSGRLVAQRTTTSAREHNRQTYILVEGADGEWRVLDNLRPAPRSTPPNRRVKTA